MSVTKSLVGLSVGLVVTVTIALAVSGGAVSGSTSRVRLPAVVPTSEPAAAYMGHRLRPSMVVGEPVEAANQGRWRD